MKATKKRAEVLYKVLLKHFKLDEFLVCYESHWIRDASKQMFIYGAKSGEVRPLWFGCNCLLELKWATKLLARAPVLASSLPNVQISINALSKYLQHALFAKDTCCSLLRIKHEIVKQILSTLRAYYRITVGISNNMCALNIYSVHKIDNLEELFIEEELTAES